MTRRFLLATVAAGAAALGLSAALAPSVAEITFLLDRVSPSNPYWVPQQWWLLYVKSPVFAASAAVMLLAPGVFTVLAWDRREGTSWSSVVARGFLISYAARVLVHSAAKLGGADLTPTVFWTAEVLLFGVATAALVLNWQRGSVRVPEGPLHRLAFILVLPMVVAVVLTPPIFWQSFTEDGLEALEIGRSLGHYIVPRFPNDSGFMGLGIGMLSMAPPVSWFIQLLGPTEAAARLPLVLYLPVAALILTGLAEHDNGRRIGAAGEAMIVLVLAGFVAVMAFSATYDAYAADAAAPTAFETLTLVCLSGSLLALWERRRGTFLGFVLLGYFARPTALMLVLLLALVTFSLFRGAERGRMLRDLALALAVCVGAILFYEKLYLQWASGGAMSYDSDSVIARYQFLRVADLRRFLWVMIPGGFLPFLALFAFPRHDRFSRQLSVVLLLYFLAFFLPAFVALHHFVPVMVLPVVVFLRLTRDAPRWVGATAVIACVLGVALSTPRHVHVDRSSHAIGSRMVFGVGQYGGSPAEDRAALESRMAIFQLFPPTWDVDAAEVRVGASLPFLYYSTRAGVMIEDADYAILPEAATAPRPFFEVGRASGAVAYARDQAIWDADLADTPPTEFGNPLFVLSPETLFSFVGVPAGEYDVNLASLPFLWRLF